MVEYSVILKRHRPTVKPDVTLFRDESRAEALKMMQKYYRQNGFTLTENGLCFSIADILLVEQEPIVGAPVLSVTPFVQLFPD